MRWQDSRLDDEARYCEGISRDGHPCRAQVGRDGGYCENHQDQRDNPLAILHHQERRTKKRIAASPMGHWAPREWPK